MTVRVAGLPSLLRAALLAGALALLPAVASAQAQGWPAVQAGARFGYDDNAQASLVGAQIRIPVLPGGQVELVPSGDVTFLDGLREYQVNADAVYVTGGRRGGLYAGGGLALRNSVFVGTERETRTGANLLFGLTTRGSFQGVPLGVQAEVRWVFLDAPFDPRTLSFGVNLPLWGWGEGR